MVPKAVGTINNDLSDPSVIFASKPCKIRRFIITKEESDNEVAGRAIYEVTKAATHGIDSVTICPNESHLPKKACITEEDIKLIANDFNLQVPYTRNQLVQSFIFKLSEINDAENVLPSRHEQKREALAKYQFLRANTCEKDLCMYVNKQPTSNIELNHLAVKKDPTSNMGRIRTRCANTKHVQHSPGPCSIARGATIINEIQPQRGTKSLHKEVHRKIFACMSINNQQAI